jgi:OFA family oxalate/formate antiporter-like MFS transporter
MIEPEISRSNTSDNRLFYGYIVIVAAFFIMLVTTGTRYAFGVFIKPMIADFGWSRAMISGAFSLSWLMECIMSFGWGILNDKLGPRVVMTICGILSGVGYLFMTQVSDIVQLYIVYGVLIGAGTSVFSPIVSTVARWFVSRRTVMTGTVTAGIGVGALIWPPIMEQLISDYDWRTTCAVIGGIVFVIAIASAQFLKRDPATVGQMAKGDRQTIEQKLLQQKDDFSLWEAILNRQFWTLFIALIFFGYALMSIQTHLVPYATDLGISAATAASILAVTGGCSVIGRVLLGSIGDRTGNKQTFIISFALLLLALIWLLFTREVWGFYLFAMVLGAAYGGLSTQLSPLVAKFFGLHSLGSIFGLVAVGFTFGSAIGPFVSGYIFDIAGSYQTAFFVCIGLSILGIILGISFTHTRIRVTGRF